MMKRLFTFIAATVMAVSAMATNYTDSLAIYINGSETPVVVPATISVDQNSDGTLKFSLKNFTISRGGQNMYIGNVSVDNVLTFDGKNGRTAFFQAATTTIENGDDDSQTWIGPLLGPVDVEIFGYELPDNRLMAKIWFDGGDLECDCYFGGGFSFVNSGFENFHKASVSSGENTAESDEPNGWHSFMSASGDPSLVYLAGYNPHTFISDVTRPGSKGSKSLMLTSVDMMFAVANGTVTTGRINTGSFTASDVANHTWLSLDSTDVDANGDPFYQYMNGRPDSLVLWVKFKQGTPNAEHPYATVTAVITDGTYYQLPSDKEYTNILAMARNNQIESKDGAWQRLSIPFDYDSYTSNNVIGRAILCTISTNADPGQGSSDTLYVDDAELIYNNEITSVSYKGETREATFNSDDDVEVTFTTTGEVNPEDVTFDMSPNSVVFFSGLEKDDDEETQDTTTDPTYVWSVCSDDLRSCHNVYVTFKGGTVGINNTPTVSSVQPRAIYNVNGQRVQTLQKGQVYILRNADGTAKKILK
ncbi:MAG: calycin-like domain-containing protein [Prevotella sp.]|jgi:hypothetical protein